MLPRRHDNRMFHLSDLDAFRPQETDTLEVLDRKAAQAREYLVTLDARRDGLKQRLERSRARFGTNGHSGVLSPERYQGIKHMLGQLSRLRQDVQHVLCELREARHRLYNTGEPELLKLRCFLQHVREHLTQEQWRATWGRVEADLGQETAA